MNNDNVSTRTPSPVLLWLVLVISSAVNAAGPLAGLGLPVRTIAGGIAIGAIALLVTHYVRRRRAERHSS
ncbi:hypothetical protein ACFVYA_05945 [Amycolatopsis sp. NPDC058278]|uniref:hypothetical protein n=1 Tax=unclassified Amycolatopsis TaxID=2618356 RepID=UPI00255BC1AC|nr:hypothetical protein [Amycolatopsis sp. DG1A-15b]WIX88159.1 hypothetical protein QRY02_44760 [Amycolatopsis sp. DG1A-15b]